MNTTNTITVSGRKLPVIENKTLAADLGFAPLTRPISVYTEEEILLSIADRLSAGGRIQWAVTLTDAPRLYATVWRTGMTTHNDFEAAATRSLVPVCAPHAKPRNAQAA